MKPKHVENCLNSRELEKRVSFISCVKVRLDVCSKNNLNHHCDFAAMPIKWNDVSIKQDGLCIVDTGIRITL